MYHSGDTCVIHIFFKYFFEKNAELCSGKGRCPFAAVGSYPIKKERKNEQLKLFKRKHRTSRAASQDIHVLLTLPDFLFRKSQNSFLKKWVKAEKIVE